MGYFLDSTDGDTAETGLTIANTDIQIRKHGATTLANKNSGGATHISGGVYQCTLDATDTDTAGQLEVYVHVSGALAVKSTFTVLTATAFDALTTGTFNNISTTEVNAECDTAITDAALATAANLATVDANVDAILLDTDDLQSNQGDWVTATGFSTLTAAQVNAEVDTALSDYDAPTRAEATADKDEILAEGAASWVTGGGGSAPTVVEIRQEIDSNSTQLAAILTDTGTTLDTKLNDIQGATFNTSTDSLEAIRDRGDASWTTGAGGSSPTVEEIRAEMDSNSTQLAAIVADTNELQGDWVDGGRLDLILDAKASQSSVDTIDGIVDNILLDTDDLQTNQGNWLTATGFNTVVPPSVSEFNARTIPSDDYFDPAVDVVARVTLVDTTTANTDMRGTDGANTTAPDNASITAILTDTGTTLPATLATLPTNAEVNAEIVDVMETDTHAEPTSAVPATSSLKDAIIWNKTVSRNKMTQTATTTLLRNDADNATISTSTVSDDGTTFTKGKHT